MARRVNKNMYKYLTMVVILIDCYNTYKLKTVYEVAF